jgi:hypothetical protein
MTPREIARRIVELRILLAQVAVSRAIGDEDQARRMLRSMDHLVVGMPLGLRRPAELVRRVEEPVNRRINRDGLLDTAERLREGSW